MRRIGIKAAASKSNGRGRRAIKRAGRSRSHAHAVDFSIREKITGHYYIQSRTSPTPGYSGYVKGLLGKFLGAEVNKYYVLPAVRLVDGRVQRRRRRRTSLPQRRKVRGQAGRAVAEGADRVRALHGAAGAVERL